MYSDNYDNEDVEESSSGKGFFGSFYENNKKLIWVLGIIILFIIIALMFTRCGKDPAVEEVKDPKLVVVNAMTNGEVKENENIFVALGNTLQLRGSIENYPTGLVVWESADSNIAEVNSTGAITGKALGTTKIKATYIHSVDKTLSMEINVTVGMGDSNVKIQSVAFPDGDLMMGVGTEYEIKLNINPSNGYITEKKYTISNPNVIEIKDDKVKALSLGSSSIELSVNNEYKATLIVYVVENKAIPQYAINVQRVQFNAASVKVKVNEIKKLDVTYEPSNSSSQAKYLKWESSDTSVVTVDSDGMIKALKEGTSNVKVTTLSGETSSILVEVEKDIVEVTDIVLSNQSISMKTGEVFTLTPSVQPSNASNKALSFASSNNYVVSVVPNDGATGATLYASNQGTAIITVKSGNISKNITVTVNGSSSSGGSQSGSSGGSSTTVTRGYSVKSTDANGEGQMNTSYDAATRKRDGSINGGPGPLVVTFTINNNTTKSLRVCYYKYGTTACDVSKASAFSDSKTLTITETGTWVFKVGEYNASGNKIRTEDNWYANVTTSSGATNKCWYNIATGDYKLSATSPGTGYTETEMSKCNGSSETPTPTTSNASVRINNPARTLTGGIDFHSVDYNNKTYVWTQITISNPSDIKANNTIYFCVDESNSRSKTPTAALGFPPARNDYYQPKNTCNKASSSTYWRLYIQKGSKVCASADVDGKRTNDVCKTVS